MAGNYVVERSQTMQADKKDVFAKLVDLREWESWSPWAELDPNMETRYSDDQGTVGSRYMWKSEKRDVGQGRMRIADIDEPNRVEIDLEFLKPFKLRSTTELFVDDSGGSTEVTWRMTGENTLMLRIMGIFKSMDKMVGPDFEKGLAKLKTVVEA